MYNMNVGLMCHVRFSVYIFGRAGKDEDVLRVRDVFEKALGVRNMLKPYVEAKSEIGDIQGDEGGGGKQ